MRCARRATSRKLSANSLRLAAGIRIFATREGAVVSTPKGCFRLTGTSAAFLMSEVLPAFGGGDNSGFRGTATELASVFGEQLQQAGILEVPAEAIACRKDQCHAARVGISRSTPLALRALERLVALGFEPAKPVCAEGSFVITDLCGLDAVLSLRLVQKIFQSGCRSISVWRRGKETFYGPISEPRSTVCWYCFRMRFSDSIDPAEMGLIENDETAARVIAENVLLAIRYPEVGGYGCVVADDGQNSSLHSVVPMPWCKVCGGVVVPSRLPRLTHSTHVPEGMRVFADPRGGVVRQIFIFEGNGIDAPAVPNCCSVKIAPFQDERLSNPGFGGEGKGATREDAVLSAIGEGVERYAASLWHPSALTYASFDELDGRAFDPRWLVLYDDAQYNRRDFAYARFDAQRRMHWTTGQWLDTGEEVKLPALATYLSFSAEASEQFGQTTSNGLAAGASFDEAALRALYELIERDAFMLSWLARRPGLRINPKGSDELIARALREIEGLGAHVELFSLDVGTGHPTVVCLGLGNGQSWPGATIGLGTHADVDVALRKAVFEHGHYGPYMRRLMREGQHNAVRNHSDVRRTLDHGLYYVHPKHVAALKSFRDAGPAVSLDELRSRYRQKATLSACVSGLLDAGIRVAAADVTSSDVAIAGIRVVRAFGVNMQPIHFGFGYERLKSPRLMALLSGEAETTPHPIA